MQDKQHVSLLTGNQVRHSAISTCKIIGSLVCKSLYVQMFYIKCTLGIHCCLVPTE